MVQRHCPALRLPPTVSSLLSPRFSPNAWCHGTAFLQYDDSVPSKVTLYHPCDDDRGRGKQSSARGGASS
jgi:hypothetical protein